MHVRAVGLLTVLLALVTPLGAQASLGLAPLPCASGGFGLPTWGFGNQFRVTRPIRVTHLCHLAIQPSDLVTPFVQLWATGTSPTLLASTAIGAQSAGSFCLTGSIHPAVMGASAIPPVDLMPGDYAVTETTLHWWFNTAAFQSHQDVLFLNSVYAGLNYFAATCVFGPSFVCEPLSASVAPLGNGCGGTVGTPTLTSSPPILGQTVTATCSNLPSGSYAWLLLGLSATSWVGIPLPFALDGLGMVGCAARVSVDVAVGGPAPAGVFTLAFPLAADPATAGTRFHLQTLALDAGANPFGAIVSNALTLTIGY